MRLMFLDWDGEEKAGEEEVQFKHISANCLSYS